MPHAGEHELCRAAACRLAPEFPAAIEIQPRPIPGFVSFKPASGGHLLRFREPAQGFRRGDLPYLGVARTSLEKIYRTAVTSPARPAQFAPSGPTDRRSSLHVHDVQRPLVGTEVIEHDAPAVGRPAWGTR